MEPCGEVSMVIEVRRVRVNGDQVAVEDKVPDGDYYLIPSDGMDALVREPVFGGRRISVDEECVSTFPWKIGVAGNSYFVTSEWVVDEKSLYVCYRTIDDDIESFEGDSE